MAVPQPRRQVQFQEETGYVFDGEVAGESEMVQVFAKFEIEASGLKKFNFAKKKLAHEDIYQMEPLTESIDQTL
jgi:hypothetical protein